MEMKAFYSELSRELRNITSLKQFMALKNKIAGKYKLKNQPSNIQILTHMNNSLFGKLKFLKTKPARTMSGVAPVAIMTKPWQCPHVKKGVGPCIYCPGGPSSFFGSTPQSYTGHEPASMRAKRNFYSPFLQVFNRLEQYALLNQNFGKVELIIMGGTFLSMPAKYQQDFIMKSFMALNEFSRLFFNENKLDFVRFKKFFELPADVHDKDRTARLQKKMQKLEKKSDIKKEHLRNEASNVRCVALALETRPDVCSKKYINDALSYGSTRIEVGVQSLSNKILKQANRGHDIQHVVKAAQLLKDSFFKVTFHIMPGLPGSTKESDIAMFKELFSNEDFKPDALKIYPCMVMPGTGLYALYKKGKFSPLATNDAVGIITEAKKYIPEYARIMRIQRDIPTKVIAAGVGLTNFRQLVDARLKEMGIKCRCIRCREPRNSKISWQDIKISGFQYKASGGTEIFISAEDSKNDLLLGFCRLRIPCKPFRPEITASSAGIREIHVYGTAASIGEEYRKNLPYQVQHKGIGKLLMEEAERIAKEEFQIKKLLVISGVGVRPYFARLGYKRDWPYMSKIIK